MNQIWRITLFSLLFGLSYMLTLRLIPNSRIVPTESVEELEITPPSTEKILPDTSVNPGSINGIIINGRLIGGTSDDHWLKPFSLAPYLIGNLTFRAYSKTEFLGEIKGRFNLEGKNGDDSLDYLNPAPPKLLKNYAFAISGGWDPFPRKPQYISKNPDKYYPLVKKVLQELHLEAPVIIKEVVQVDLAGDGTDEVLITATHQPGSPDTQPTAPDLKKLYSLVLLYQVNDGLETGTVLIGSYQEPTTYEILTVADLNGDWTMEFIVRESEMKHGFHQNRIIHRDLVLKLENKEPRRLLDHKWSEEVGN